MRRLLASVGRWLMYPKVRGQWADQRGLCSICMRPLPADVKCDACAPLR